MGVRIRDAVPEDASSLVEIAASVGLRDLADAGQQERGFLIDISLEQYQHFIANDQALVMQEDDSGRLAGFSVVLGPRTMEATGIRRKAERIEGSSVRIGELDPDACAYWEQLAFRPRYAKKIYPVYLAFVSLRRAFLRYDHLFGAVVGRPLRNMAPLRFLEFTGWRSVGWIDEDYLALGRVRYDVYYLSRSRFEEKLREPFFVRLEQRLRDHAVIGDGA